MTAAQWISPIATTVSTLETGNVQTITAWGGSVFGHSYTFALSGAPAGVTIDADLGILNIGTALSAGSYTFTIVVTSRRTSEQASFTFGIAVNQGITVGTPTASQILHKTYSPHGGTYGTDPGSGGDYTTIFNAIKTQILADQETLDAIGNGLLRVDVPLKGGFVYNYTENRWCAGTQYLHVFQDPNFAGAKPQLCCTKSSFSFDVEVATAQFGGGTFLDFLENTTSSNAKTWQSLINDTAVGDVTVTLKTLANTSNLRLGRWHLVLSYDQQGNGGPPNSRYYDFVKINNINTSTGVITLDRPLRHVHKALYWETYPQDGISFGQARIMPWDVGGAGGVENNAGGTGTTMRLCRRLTLNNLEFVTNPHFTTPEGVGTFTYMQGVIETFVSNCTVKYPVVSMTKHAYFTNCTVSQRAEMDKLMETCAWDNCTIGADATGDAFGDATGVECLTIRSCNSPASSNSAPRLLRTIGSTFDATSVPGNAGVNDILFFTGIPGPINYVDFENTSFKADTAHTDGSIMPIRDTTVVSLTLGTDATWSTNRLVIPVNNPGGSTPFTLFLGYAQVNTIIYSGGANFTIPHPLTTWGYINNITSPGDGSALWLDVTWVGGVKPTTGTLWLSRVFEVYAANTSTIVAGGTKWSSSSGGAYKQTVPSSWGSTYDYPAGYPASEIISLSGTVRAESQGFAHLTVTGSPIVNFVGTTRAMSKGDGRLTVTGGGGGGGVGTITIVSCIATFSDV